MGSRKFHTSYLSDIGVHQYRVLIKVSFGITAKNRIAPAGLTVNLTVNDTD